MFKINLFVFVFLGTFTMYKTSLAEIHLSGSKDFGLFPTEKEDSKKKHLLPACDDPKYAKEAKTGYCLGSVLPEETFGISLDGEWIYEEYIIRIIKRNPALVGFAEFLEICRPRGGILSPDKMSCEYTIWF